MRFFFDNTFPPKLVEFIEELALETGLEVKHLREKYSPDTPDEVWITKLSKEGEWIIVSGDTRIVKNPINKAALEKSGLTIFVFPKDFSRKNRWEQSWRTIKIWPEILKQAKHKPPGAIFTITGSYKITD